jgi:pyruvate dehydrogenase E2 component (dihydrolipoamide acetyltransferase)
MPSFGMYTVEGTLVKWLEPAGAHVAEGRPILEIETDKATQEVIAPAEGRLHHVAAEGDLVSEQGLLGYILGDGEEPPARPEPARETAGPVPTAATPAARRLAREHGLELSALTGSGPGGRIVEADVQAALSLPGERAPLSPMRRAIANRLIHSVTEAIPCTLTREVEAEALALAREQAYERVGTSIPFDAYFAKLLAGELLEHPELNVVLDGDSLVRLEQAHIGIAVATTDGLVAPVVRDPDREPLAAIAGAIRELAERARARTLRPADLEGASSTVTNLGGHGIDAFTPILNPPQTTILGIGRLRSTAALREGELISVRSVVLSLTFDHRVADGASAAALLEGLDRRMNDAGYLAGLD